MDAIKVDNFRRSYPDGKFPEFASLGSDQCATIRESIARRLRLPPDTTPLEIVLKIREQGDVRLGDVPTLSGFDVRGRLLGAGVQLGNQVYLNWYRFDDIDRIGVDDLATHFDDIWYPGSDDIDLFDRTLCWVLSIAHTGKVVLYPLPDEPSDPGVP